MEVRVWTLNGHVVPEVKVDGRWEMYDSDTGIIYYNDSNQIAGVEELMTDPTLIRATRGYIRATKLDDAFPFSDELAGIYSSVEDNQVMDGYTSPIPRADASIAMPARRDPGFRWRMVSADLRSSDGQPHSVQSGSTPGTP
ncbi:MAG: hypothetical protein KIS79_04080 [Burkholderiales bacterium]|nr:hypothetical protein [Burkholderiales bacterium]